MTVAFVIGNGESRKDIDLYSLKNYGKVYACNAVYRHFQPHYLVAVDVKMILEINQCKWQMENEVWTNPNKQFNAMQGFKFFQPSKGWSSGPTALWLASTHGHDTIYILGFDYQGLGHNKEEVNNIYAGTDNYKRTNDKATYYGNWTRQTMMVANNYPKIRYVRVVAEGDYFIPDHLKDIQNISHITVPEFRKKFKVK